MNILSGSGKYWAAQKFKFFSCFSAMGIVLFLSSCGTLLSPGPPPARMQLSPALPAKYSGPALDRQLIVALPQAGRDIDTDSITLVFGLREVRYLSGAKWTNTVPQLIQRALIDGLESSAALRGVTDESAGIAAGAKLLCDIKQFSLHYPEESAIPVARFQASLRLINLNNGSVAASKILDIAITAGSKNNEALIRACEQALSKGLAEAVPWVVDSMHKMK